MRPWAGEGSGCDVSSADEMRRKWTRHRRKSSQSTSKAESELHWCTRLTYTYFSLFFLASSSILPLLQSVSYTFIYTLLPILLLFFSFSFSSSFSPRISFLAQSFLFSSHSIIYTVRPIQNSPPLQFLTIYFNFESVNRSKLMASVFATRVY